MPHVVPALFVNVLWLVLVHKCVGLILLLFQPKKFEKKFGFIFSSANSSNFSNLLQIFTKFMIS